MEQTVTIIINELPYKNDKAWNALRLAGALLDQKVSINLFLLEDGVDIGKEKQCTKELIMTRQKTIIITFLLSLSVMLSSAYPVFAQGMMGNNMMGNEDTTVGNTDGHTAREEAEGKKIRENLQAKELKCEDLSDDNFGALGEYFMGQMAGGQHKVMNNMMIQMMGEEGEEQMHVVMGKRLSGCDTSAAMPTSGMSSMPMIQMMMGGGSTMMGYGGWNNVMGGWGVFGILWLVTWLLIIIALIALIRWLWKKGDKVK